MDKWYLAGACESWWTVGVGHCRVPSLEMSGDSVEEAPDSPIQASVTGMPLPANSCQAGSSLAGLNCESPSTKAARGTVTHSNLCSREASQYTVGAVRLPQGPSASVAVESQNLQSRWDTNPPQVCVSPSLFHLWRMSTTIPVLASQDEQCCSLLEQVSPT